MNRRPTRGAAAAANRRLRALADEDAAGEPITECPLCAGQHPVPAPTGTLTRHTHVNEKDYFAPGGLRPRFWGLGVENVDCSLGRVWLLNRPAAAQEQAADGLGRLRNRDVGNGRWRPEASLPTSLYLAPSIIPAAGLGVFTARRIRRGTLMGPYTGRRVQRRPNGANYTISLGNYFLDAGDPRFGNWLRMINHYEGQDTGPNGERENLIGFKLPSQTEEGEYGFFCVANQDIPAHSELFWSYGDEAADIIAVPSIVGAAESPRVWTAVRPPSLDIRQFRRCFDRRIARAALGTHAQALATLPDFLLFGAVNDANHPGQITTHVYAREPIPAGTCFGPLMGERLEQLPPDSAFTWLLSARTRHGLAFFDASLPQSANWMRFIRKAPDGAQGNLAAYLYRNRVFYVTLAPIEPHQKLLLRPDPPL